MERPIAGNPRTVPRGGGGNAGFTLIEVMVVVVILGILAGIVVPQVIDQIGRARVEAVKTEIREIESALKLYRLDNFRYPTTDQGLEALVQRPPESVAPNWKASGYLSKLPVDPWGNPYQYLSPGQKGEIDVYSLGADGQLGGSGEDADVGNWEID